LPTDCSTVTACPSARRNSSDWSASAKSKRWPRTVTPAGGASTTEAASSARGSPPRLTELAPGCSAKRMRRSTSAKPGPPGSPSDCDTASKSPL
jgi:hypothetical protein